MRTHKPFGEFPDQANHIVEMGDSVGRGVVRHQIEDSRIRHMDQDFRVRPLAARSVGRSHLSAGLSLPTTRPVPEGAGTRRAIWEG